VPKAPLIPVEDVDARLSALRGWRRQEARLVKVFTFADFGEAVAFIEALVAPADEQNHHPDVTIHWNEVTLALWTHASGGITERDFTLATTIDHLTEELDANA
jgi:4a-hydroxytetrahydrobiopterin dehydratase